MEVREKHSIGKWTRRRSGEKNDPIDRCGKTNLTKPRLLCRWHWAGQAHRRHSMAGSQSETPRNWHKTRRFLKQYSLAPNLETTDRRTYCWPSRTHYGKPRMFDRDWNSSVEHHLASMSEHWGHTRTWCMHWLSCLIAKKKCQKGYKKPKRI